MSANAVRSQVLAAAAACEEKKALDLSILELEKGSGAFTDYFVICSGANPRQVQTIAEAVEERLKSKGLRIAHSEGYQQAEWVLLDYVDFVVHIFSQRARRFYDLERLWRSARKMTVAELAAPVRKAARAKAAKLRAGARKPAKKTKTRPKRGRKKRS